MTKNPIEQKDLTAKPLSFLVAWGLPILLLLLANIPALRGTPAVLLIMAGFAWMGTACLINAKRCRRRHCFYTGPLFLLTSLLSGLVGFGVVDLGSDGLIIVVWGSIILALATTIPEKIWGKYVE